MFVQMEQKGSCDVIERQWKEPKQCLFERNGIEANIFLKGSREKLNNAYSSGLKEASQC